MTSIAICKARFTTLFFISFFYSICFSRIKSIFGNWQAISILLRLITLLTFVVINSIVLSSFLPICYIYIKKLYLGVTKMAMIMDSIISHTFLSLNIISIAKAN